ncbi:hypothetical protein FH966_00625 [Lentibacillus cibarius]|uniref:Uncharacterized protein n=1 Tax=Lentibacillus cibarius TaxID=2583219 RepID=A0A549YEM9_9BACI|nr:hypothetical protein [Lentibacillus cibarius]TRM10341.1 hypothetical protein FH966_00625 [Lentibacillus cibarius]
MKNPFKNEKLQNVNSRLVELKEKRESLANEIEEIQTAMNDTFESYAVGTIEAEDVRKAEKLLREKKDEYKQNEEMISKVEAVKTEVKKESVPYYKEMRQKKLQDVQKRYDDKVQDVHEARNEFLRQLNELGQIKKEANRANTEYNNVMADIGEESNPYLTGIQEKPFIKGSLGVVKDNETIGVREDVQRQAYEKVLPQFAEKGGEE